MKNRTVIGIVCIILAVVVTFVVSPVVNKMSEGKTAVVCFSKDISQGSEISEDDIAIIEVSKSGLPENAVTDKTLVLGRYANSDLYKGDIATPAKLTDDANSSKNILSSLGGDKVAMSITISSFAGGLSGKLQSGDIVSIYVTDKDGNTTVPAELEYVKVITTTTSGGVDENEVVPNEDGSFALPTTITVLVSVKQAEILANNEKNATMHVALVHRGDDSTSQQLLDTQDNVLKTSGENTAPDGGNTNG